MGGSAPQSEGSSHGIRPAATDGSESRSRRSASVLVVDDDPALRDTLCRMLESIGYRAESCADARAAIDAIERRRPDIVISDVYMPVGDGFELLNWIRRQAVDLPVVVISGSSSQSYDPLELAERLGAAAVLDKPFRQSQLAETIDRVLARRPPPPRA
ncbi:MAG TPA: response regulator [Candidatus Cybelea sp.]|nr:response regulator [Candidatus Cybelea sp.]